MRGIAVYGARSLGEVAAHLNGIEPLTQTECKLTQRPSEQSKMPDLADVKGQHTARLALEIAAAGGHSLLMMGPPGTGKSMLSQRLPGILPPLTETNWSKYGHCVRSCPTINSNSTATVLSAALITAPARLPW